MAFVRSAAVAVGALAFLSAVRSAERWARLRTVAARDFRMFFLADAIFGTKVSKNSVELADVAKPGTYWRNGVKSSWDSALLSSPTPLPYARCAPWLAGSRRPRPPPLQTLQTILLVAPVLLFSVIAHEIAHGYAALRQGDRTALEAGRLSWNPVKHIDLYMTILLPLIMLAGSHFAGGRAIVLGGAKPVPVDPRNYRNIRRGDIIVSLAGVATNALVAILCAVCIAITGLVGQSAPYLANTIGILQAMFIYGIQINAIAPGYFKTPLNQALVDSAETAKGALRGLRDLANAGG